MSSQTPFTSRPFLPVSQISPAVLAQMNSYFPAVVQEVSTAVNRDPVVVVGMSVNPFVKTAKKALDEAKVPYTYLEYGGYLSRWNDRLAIKMWSGYPTFPQVFVNGVLIGGGAETAAACKSGEIHTMLAGGRKTADSTAAPSSS